MLTPTTAILVGAVALIIFGPKQLPELAKSLGKAMGEFKKGLSGEPEATTGHTAGLPAPAAQAANVPIASAANQGAAAGGDTNASAK